MPLLSASRATLSSHRRACRSRAIQAASPCTPIMASDLGQSRPTFALTKHVLLRWLWFGWLATLVATFVSDWTRKWWWQGARLDFAMISCLLLAVAAWVAWSRLRGTSAGRVMFWIAVGMTLGFYGDSHVGERFWWPPFPHAIVGGIIFYGLGHLAYVGASLLAARMEGLAGGWRWCGPILAWQLVALVAWAAVALTSDKEAGLRIPTLIYTLLVAATPGFGAALAAQRPRYGWLALGGALFLASDILLAWQLFHGAFAGLEVLKWTAYGGGEMLIVYGAIYALDAPQLSPTR